MNIPLWKKIFSYFYPLVLNTYQSKYNGVLELGLQNGKIVLDSKNANYSFGSLHTLFQKAINKLQLSKDYTYKTLILGFGAGSIAHILDKKKEYLFEIEGIEIDPVIIDISKQYFATDTIQNCTIRQEDASLFLSKYNNTYDLIFVDLFIDKNVPVIFQQHHFLQLIKQHLSINGHLMMNIMSDFAEKEFKDTWANIFSTKGQSRQYHFIETNTIYHFHNLH